MADPKYAGLPGIAYDQPDVYESEDITDSNQDLSSNQDQSDCIENLSTNIKESFAKFEGHWLDSRKADFSGKITMKKHEGYSAWMGPFELQAKGEVETPVQKLNRLKCELADLQEELAQPKPEETLTIGALTQQVDFLYKQLMAIKLEEDTGNKYSTGTGTNWISKKELFSNLEQVLQTASALKNSPATISGEGKVVYELQYQPHQANLGTASKTANLLNRLNRLEILLGSNHEKMMHLSAETGQKSLTDAVKSIHSKVYLLEPSHIDQVEARLGLLVQRLNTITDKHSALEEADKSRKITEVYDMIRKLEPLFSVLPTVVDRLIALKSLHEEAVNFHQSLTQVESSQSRFDQSLSTHANLLKDIKEGLASNISTTQAALQQFEERLSKLKK